MSSSSPDGMRPPEPAAVPPPPDLKARILAAARSEPVPTRATSRRRELWSLLAGFAWMALFFFGWMHGVVVLQRPPGHIVFVGAGWLLLAGAVTFLSASRGHSMLGRPRQQLALAASLLVPLLTAWALLGNLVWPEANALTCPRPYIHFLCFRNALLMGLGPFIGFLIIRRGSDPLHPRWTGVALGSAAGAWGSWAIGLHCPFTEMGHVVLSHVLPSALLAVIGLLVGPHVLALRDRSSRSR